MYAYLASRGVLFEDDEPVEMGELSVSKGDEDLYSDGSRTTLVLCRKIQNTSFVTLTTSLHHTPYGLSRRISSTKGRGRASSFGSGSWR